MNLCINCHFYRKPHDIAMERCTRTVRSSINPVDGRTNYSAALFCASERTGESSDDPILSNCGEVGLFFVPRSSHLENPTDAQKKKKSKISRIIKILKE